MFDYSLSLGIPIVPSSPHSNPPSSRKSPHLSPGYASSPKEKLSGRYSTGSTSRRAPLSTRPPSPPEKKLLHITTLIEADYFGEMAILKGEKEEPISVISEGQVEVFHLPRLDFNRYILLINCQTYIFFNCCTCRRKNARINEESRSYFSF